VPFPVLISARGQLRIVLALTRLYIPFGTVAKPRQTGEDSHSKLSSPSVHLLKGLK